MVVGGILGGRSQLINRRRNEAGDEIVARDKGREEQRSVEGRRRTESDVLAGVGIDAAVERRLGVRGVEERAGDKRAFDVAELIVDHDLVADIGDKSGGARLGGKDVGDANPRRGHVIVGLPGVADTYAAEVGGERGVGVVGYEGGLRGSRWTRSTGVKWRAKLVRDGVGREEVDRERVGGIVLRGGEVGLDADDEVIFTIIRDNRAETDLVAESAFERETEDGMSGGKSFGADAGEKRVVDLETGRGERRSAIDLNLTAFRYGQGELLLCCVIMRSDRSTHIVVGFVVTEDSVACSSSNGGKGLREDFEKNQ